MFEHIRKKFPWLDRAERQRKEDFIKKLQEPGHGKPKIRFKNINKIPVGAMIMLQDYGDGSMVTAVYSGNGWFMMGTNSPGGSVRPTTVLSIEFEDMLTEKRNKATATSKFLIVDDNQLLNINYIKHPSNAGFHKIQWHDIGNDEDE